MLLSDGNELQLPRRKPEGPLSSSRLSKDGQKSLDRAEDSSMDDDWAGEVLLDWLLNLEELLLA